MNLQHFRVLKPFLIINNLQTLAYTKAILAHSFVRTKRKKSLTLGTTKTRVMKKPIILLTAIILTALSGCNEPAQPILLNKVESLMCSQPDSANALLASIDTDTLNDGSFAHWCLLKAELSHRTSHVSVPSVEDMEKTFDWYKRQGTEEESLKAEFYLGMAHAHAGESEQAMNIYARTYAIAEKKRITN